MGSRENNNLNTQGTSGEQACGVPKAVSESRDLEVGLTGAEPETTNSGVNEGLASGVQTLGLKRKRLSGAQRKKLVKERKMREGTWTEARPKGRPKLTTSHQTDPGEGTSSGVGRQDQPKAGTSSRAEKRPRSNPNTPDSQEHTHKRARDVSYKDATLGTRMAVVHEKHPAEELTEEQAKTVERRVVELIFSDTASGPPLQFMSTKFAQGILWIVCANDESKRWLTETIPGLGNLWEGASLRVVEAKDLPKRPKVMVWIPDNEMEADTIKTALQRQNPGLKAKEWVTLNRKVTGSGQTLVFTVDPASYTRLEDLEFKAFWGLKRVIFKTLEVSNKTTGRGSSR